MRHLYNLNAHRCIDGTILENINNYFAKEKYYDYYNLKMDSQKLKEHE